MKTNSLSLLCGLLTLSGSLCAAAPFDPDNWPSVADPTKVAHYISTDFVVRVEAYAPDEAAAKLAFDTLLQRQLAKFPATA